MQFLDKTGVGTLWSMCKTKFALKDHSHNYLPLYGGTLTGDLLFSNSGTTFRQIRGTCGDNDFWRIGGGATENNAGYMEIATADDGSEPIYVRQYSGVFSSVVRTLTLLDANGYTHFPSYINIGGNENNNSSPDRVWGSNGSDSYLRSYRTSALNVNYANSAGNADTVDGYHASSLWRSDGGTWNPSANISLTASGNNQEWSFDIGRNGYTGCYWQVWDNNLDTLLKVNADNGKVYAPYNFVGNLEGNASTASNASTVNGHTVNANVPSNAKFTDTNTWRPIQDNLTSTSTSESLSANLGRVLKGLVDGKANSSDLSSYSQKDETVKNISNITLGDSLSGYKQILEINYANGTTKNVEISNASNGLNGFMSASDKNKLENIAVSLSDVCKFNFVNSISECKNKKINFFLKTQTNGNTILDLKDFENCEEGTILLLAVYNPYGNIYIKNSSHNWYFNMESISANLNRYWNSGSTMLATIKSGEIYVFT